jgi:hypothetical protein
MTLKEIHPKAFIHEGRWYDHFGPEDPVWFINLCIVLASKAKNGTSGSNSARDGFGRNQHNRPYL